MGRLDRRALFTSGAAAALLAATGVSLEASPRSGGRLRLAVPRDQSFDSVVRGAVYEALTEIGPDGLLRGELATDWRSSDEARQWVFDLKPGVFFHDGSPMTATDVVASLHAAGFRASQVTDGNRVKVRLDLPDPGLPMTLAAVPIARAQDIHAPAASPIGTGFYRVERFEAGRQFLGRRVEVHHRQGQAGWADTVEVVVIPDQDVRAEALRDGFVDVAVLPAPGGLLGRGEFRYHPSTQHMALAAHTGVGMPRVIAEAPLDGGRIAERWWLS